MYILLVVLFFFVSFTPAHASSIVINEMYPNPPGSEEDDEYVELYNSTDGEIAISGWKLDDETGGGSAPYTIPEGTTIAAKGYISFKKSVSKISLNNSGDTVSLLDTSEAVVDSYTYSTIEEAKTVGRSPDGGNWGILASATENSANVSAEPTITSKPTPSTKPTVTDKPSSTPKPNPTTKSSLASKSETTKAVTSETSVNTLATQLPNTTRSISTSPKLATSSASTVAGVMVSATIEPSVSDDEDKKTTTKTLIAGQRTYGFIAVAAGILSIIISVIIYRKRAKYI